MQVQLYFTDANMVSQNIVPCRIKVLFGDGSNFMNAGFGINLEKGL